MKKKKAVNTPNHQPTLPVKEADHCSDMPTEQTLSEMIERKRECEKTLPKPTEQQQKTIQAYGRIILAELAYGIKDKCPCPFAKDGKLTKKGAEAAREIVDNLLNVNGGDYFDEVTEDLLRTFREYYDHPPTYRK